jgi:hypothetical protein
VEALYKENDKWYVDVKHGEEEELLVSWSGWGLNDEFAQVQSVLTEGQEVVVGTTNNPEEEGSGEAAA